MRALVVLLLLAPTASALLVLEDPEGDATASVQGQVVPVDRARMADLLALDITEDDEGFLFTLGHGEVPDPGILGVEAVEYLVHFRHNDAWFVARGEVWYPLVTPSPTYRVSLYTADEAGEIVDEMGQPDLRSADATTFVFHIPRDSLRDRQGTPPTAGRALEDFRAWTKTAGIVGASIGGQSVDDQGPQYQDAMPDEGVSPVRLESTHGYPQSGLHLSSPTPLRWSNGEATGFVYSVLVQEAAGEDQVVTLAAEGVPPGWTVVVPDPFPLATGEARTVDVVAHVPFAHDHGATTTFRLKATSGLAGSLGLTDLGVHYAEVPQPTGHHDMLFLHSHEAYDSALREALFSAIGTPDRFRVTMNTLETDPADEGMPVPGKKTSLEVGEGSPYRIAYTWRVPLAPSLRMGLDMDRGAMGEIRVDIASPVDMLDVELRGRLWVGPPGLEGELVDSQSEDGQTLASVESEPVAAGTAATLEGAITPAGAGDRIAFDPGQQLYLDLLVFTDRPELILTPSIGMDLLGGSLRLPLEEYHDSVPVQMTQAQQKLLEETAPGAAEAPADEAVRTPAPGAIAVGLVLVAARRLRC